MALVVQDPIAGVVTNVFILFLWDYSKNERNILPDIQTRVQRSYNPACDISWEVRLIFDVS